jgi:hypothetical protein
MRGFLAAFLAALSLHALAQLPPAETAQSAGAEQRHSNANSPAYNGKTDEGSAATFTVHIQGVDPGGEHKNSTEAGHENREPKQSGWNSWGISEKSAVASAIGTVVSALTTIALCVLGYFTWRASQAATRIASDSAVIAKSALEASQDIAFRQSRAYLYVTSIELVYETLGFNIPTSLIVNVSNYGKTPAQLLSLQLRAIEGAAEHEALSFGRQSIIPPDGTLSLSVELGLDDGEAVHEMKTPLTLVACVEYLDIEGGAHETVEPFGFTKMPIYGFGPEPSHPERRRS